jgi:hypothetical protein
MKNQISIRTVNHINEFELTFTKIKRLDLEYILCVNGEEITISKDMAFGIATALDEYKQEVCNEFEDKRFPYTFHKTFGEHKGTDK